MDKHSVYVVQYNNSRTDVPDWRDWDSFPDFLEAEYVLTRTKTGSKEFLAKAPMRIILRTTATIENLIKEIK